MDSTRGQFKVSTTQNSNSPVCLIFILRIYMTRKIRIKGTVLLCTLLINTVRLCYKYMKIQKMMILIHMKTYRIWGRAIFFSGGKDFATVSKRVIDNNEKHAGLHQPNPLLGVIMYSIENEYSMADLYYETFISKTLYSQVNYE